MVKKDRKNKGKEKTKVKIARKNLSHKRWFYITSWGRVS